MVARFEPRKGLDLELAQRVAAPRVRRILNMLNDEAQRRAPATRVWVTMRDERVRTTHFETDAQIIPTNLRFKMPNRYGTGFDMARYPRDPELPKAQRDGCRCDDPTLPQPLRDSIHTTDVTVIGTRATGSVETKFPRAAESENGSMGDPGAYFMLGALQEVAARLRAGQFT